MAAEGAIIDRALNEQGRRILRKLQGAGCPPVKVSRNRPIRVQVILRVCKG